MGTRSVLREGNEDRKPHDQRARRTREPMQIDLTRLTHYRPTGCDARWQEVVDLARTQQMSACSAFAGKLEEFDVRADGWSATISPRQITYCRCDIRFFDG